MSDTVLKFIRESEDFPSDYTYRVYKGSLEISEEEGFWLRSAQRSWFLQSITSDEKINSVTKLNEVRSLLEEWSRMDEQEEDC